MHHKRRRPKHQRAGCLLCKPHKDERQPKFLRLKGLKAPRRLQGAWVRTVCVVRAPDFTCFQNQQQTGAIATGARVELGSLWNTSGRVAVGPWAPPTK